MASFAYRGRNGAGEIVQGIMEGATAGAIADQLSGTGVVPMEIKATAAAADKAGSGAGFEIKLFKQKVEHMDVLLFSRQIHTLLRAGVPIMRALAGLQESSANPAMREVLQDVRESLDSGREMSLSLARHPKVFSPFYLSMVRVGEMTGRLEEVFIRLFDHLAFERFMKEQVKSALRYPSFVVAAMAIAIVIVNMFVIPAFAKVFKGFGAELPLMTRMLIGFSDFMLAWWPALLLGIVGRRVRFQYLAQDSRRPLHLGSFQAADSDRREDRAKGYPGPLCRQLRAGVPQRRADHPGPDQCCGDRGQRLHLGQGREDARWRRARRKHPAHLDHRRDVSRPWCCR
jgi:MSHA biogenesis protein MshG